MVSRSPASHHLLQGSRMLKQLLPDECSLTPLRLLPQSMHNTHGPFLCPGPVFLERKQKL